jgi:hypothetical protein
MTMRGITASERALVAILTNANDIPASRRDAILSAITEEPKSLVPPVVADRVLDVSEAATSLRQTRRTVFRLLKEGNLTRVKLPGRKRGCGILASSVSELLRRCATKGVQ